MIVPKEAFASYARSLVDGHADWDGEHLSPGVWCCILPDVDPKDYPQWMIESAGRYHEEFPGNPAVGYMLMVESWGVYEPGPDTVAREQYERDRKARTFHLRADRFEMVCAWCADVHGRLWSADKRRDTGEVRERFQPPGLTHAGQPSFDEPVIAGLLAVAYATGMQHHGLPGIQRTWN